MLRRGEGDPVEIFNGHDGTWSARIDTLGRKAGTLVAESQIAPQRNAPDLWLLFAPIKKARTDFIVEKAAELGVARIRPVRTAFTNSERLRRDRLQAHAVEAAEQCGGNFVPEVDEIVPLDALLDTWPTERHLLFCDEARSGAVTGLEGLSAPGAVLIGPEGGFADAERRRLEKIARTVSLGPRILRADTAAVAALTLWQQAMGDWR